MVRQQAAVQSTGGGRPNGRASVFRAVGVAGPTAVHVCSDKNLPVSVYRWFGLKPKACTCVSGEGCASQEVPNNIDDRRVFVLSSRPPLSVGRFA